MMQQTAARFSHLDRFFAFLRVVTLAGGLLWLQFGLTMGDGQLKLSWLFGAFICYGLVLYGLVLYGRLSLERMYLVALFLDFAFIATLVSLTGGLKSVFIVAFYLLIGLHSFYFGLKIGVSIGAAAIAFYLVASLASLSAPGVEQIIRVGFMILIAVAAGLMSDKARRDRERIEQLVRDLQTASRVIERSEKIALLGRLSAGIAHEINNPVSVIATRTERMLLEAQEKSQSGYGDRRLIADLKVINTQAYRIASIILSMLAFSRDLPLRMVPLDINEIVNKAVALIEHRLSERQLTLNLNLLRHLPRVVGDANRLQEVLINILNNAIDASGEGGRLYVITTVSGGQQKVLQVFVTDAGEGMSPDVLEKVFDPFFTTKEVGQGTGLGLYVCYQILQEHGGTIDIESEPHQGTTVSISLPIISDAFLQVGETD
jgi:signal transduction histidine kinase